MAYFIKRQLQEMIDWTPDLPMEFVDENYSYVGETLK